MCHIQALASLLGGRAPLSARAIALPGLLTQVTIYVYRSHSVDVYLLGVYSRPAHVPYILCNTRAVVLAVLIHALHAC
jgi:hypothetical protein